MKALGIALALSFSLVPVHAQFTSAIEGTVTDPSGAFVPAATVTALNTETGFTRSISTSGRGYFRLSQLTPGLFKLTVAASGFKTAVQDNIVLEVAGIKTVNVALELGVTSSEVNVTTDVALVESSEARVSNVIKATQVRELPLTGRNFWSLVVLTPGVTGLPTGGGNQYSSTTGDIYSTQFSINMNANGQRSEANQFQVDGASVNGSPHGGVVNVNPNPESVQELRVQVNNFSAEYGGNSSALVSVITKQGTNNLHGAAMWYFTDNLLNARNVFANEVPKFHRNQMSGSIGGPIRKDRTFFFGTVDVLRSGVPATLSNSAVTPQFANVLAERYPNNISTLMVTKFPAALDPTSGGLYAGPLAGSVPNLAACSGLPGGAATPVSTPVGMLPCNFQLAFNGVSGRTTKRNGQQYNARVDHGLNNSKDRIYGSFYLTQTVLGTTNTYPAFQVEPPEGSSYMNFNQVHTFSPITVNELVFSQTREWGTPGIGNNARIPNVSVPGMAGYGGSPTRHRRQSNEEWRDQLTSNHGSHAFRIGVRFTLNHLWVDYGIQYTRPSFTSLNLYDFALDKPFSEGNYGFSPRTGPGPGPDMSVTLPLSWNAFYQDDWKLRKNLTISYGVRWDVFRWPISDNDQFSALVFGPGNTFMDRLATAKSLQANYRLTRQDYNNVAPRLGIAWDPSGKGRMSIRAGVGLFYDKYTTQLFNESLTCAPVFGVASVSQQTAPAVPVYGLGKSDTPPYDFAAIPNLTVGLDPNGGLIGAPSAIGGVADPNLRTPYSINSFFGIQYSFANQWVVEGNYVGSLGRKLYEQINVNVRPGDLLLNNGISKQLNSSFSQIGYAESNGTSSYNGLNLSVKKRYSYGLDFGAAYTLGKAIDISSTYGPGTPAGLSIPNPWNLPLEKAAADFDIRHKLAMNIMYELPKFGGAGALGRFVSGWKVSAVTILQTGAPFSVYCSQAFIAVRNASGAIVGNNGCDFNANAKNYDRPDTPAFGNTKTGFSRSNYQFPNYIFSASDFPKPALGHDGTLGRNTFRGPGYADTDLNVTKMFRITERTRVEFRGEFFNVFNRVNLGGMITDMNSTRFGSATTAFSGRSGEFGLKFSF
ncbi:MAG: TonB-dependent receptor [Bryobacteraceae bacterium]|jgi:hypothetical protein